jgi:acyl-CoA dehydrogenase
MLENIFEYSLLSFLLSIVLILLVLVKTNIKMWQLWLLAVGLTYPGAVIANHFGAQFLLLKFNRLMIYPRRYGNISLTKVF